MSEEDPLIDAVHALRLSEPGLSAKQVHARLVSEAAWEAATLGDVKKACSKATKRYGAAVAALAPRAAVELPNDAVARLGPCASMDVCDQFAAALWERLTGASLPRDASGLPGGTPVSRDAALRSTASAPAPRTRPTSSRRSARWSRSRCR